MSEQATAPVTPTQVAPSDVSTQFVPDTSSHAVPGRDFNATIRAVANKTAVAPDAPVETAPVVKIVRDPVNAEGERIIPTPVETAPTETVEPAGELSVDGGEITLTAQRNADGTFKAKLDPNEKVDFTIKSVIDPTTGKPKVYTKSLPELARMAKDSVTLNQTVQKVQEKLTTIEPEVEFYRTNVPKWQATEKTLREELENMRALNTELLSAEDEIVIQRREQYMAEMTPAKQLARLKAEREAEKTQALQREQQTKEQAQHERIAKAAGTFVESRIAPSLAAAEAVIGVDAVKGKAWDLTQDLTVRGVIPPANWPEMERRFNSPTGPFQEWVKAESAKRTVDSDAVRKAREDAEAAQRRAQQVVNTDGRLMAPIGRAGPDSAPTLAPAKNSKEVLDRIIHRPLPESVSRSA